MHTAGVCKKDSASVIIYFSSRFDKFFSPLFICLLVGDGTVSDQCNFQFHFEHTAKDTKNSAEMSYEANGLRVGCHSA